MNLFNQSGRDNFLHPVINHPLSHRGFHYKFSGRCWADSGCLKICIIMKLLKSLKQLRQETHVWRFHSRATPDVISIKGSNNHTNSEISFTCLFTITLSARISRYISLPCFYTVMSFGVKVERRHDLTRCLCVWNLRPLSPPQKIK